jgi:predicted RNA binding protein YcfA (HicA-like mRNA interferase family)
LLTAKELKKLLKAHGCTFKIASGHDKVYLGNRMTVLPRHGTDIGPYLFNKILKDLGIEKEK